jgi:hypothetical protein
VETGCMFDSVGCDALDRLGRAVDRNVAYLPSCTP